MWQVIGHHSCRAQRQLVKLTTVQVTTTWQWSSWNHNKNIWIICGHKSIACTPVAENQPDMMDMDFDIVDVGPTLLGWLQILAFDFSRRIRILISHLHLSTKDFPIFSLISYLSLPPIFFFSLSSFSPASYFVRFSRETKGGYFVIANILSTGLHWIGIWACFIFLGGLRF